MAHERRVGLGVIVDEYFRPRFGLQNWFYCTNSYFLRQPTLLSFLSSPLRLSLFITFIIMATWEETDKELEHKHQFEKEQLEADDLQNASWYAIHQIYFILHLKYYKHNKSNA